MSDDGDSLGRISPLGQAREVEVEVVRGDVGGNREVLGVSNPKMLGSPDYTPQCGLLPTLGACNNGITTCYYYMALKHVK